MKTECDYLDGWNNKKQKQKQKQKKKKKKKKTPITFAKTHPKW